MGEEKKRAKLVHDWPRFALCAVLAVVAGVVAVKAPAQVGMVAGPLVGAVVFLAGATRSFREPKAPTAAKTPTIPPNLPCLLLAFLTSCGSTFGGAELDDADKSALKVQADQLTACRVYGHSFHDAGPNVERGAYQACKADAGLR